MAALIFVFANIIILASSQQRCPSSAWISCAEQHGGCRIPGTIKEGYMSYGVEKRWNLVPFSNYGNVGMTIRCGQDFERENPWIGKFKFCCYIAADIGINVNGFSGTLADDGSGYKLTVPWPYTFRKGVDNQWLYRTSYDAFMRCSKPFMGDIMSDKAEICQGMGGFPDSVPAITSNDWVICGNEHRDCTGLDKNAPQWIRFGTDGHYYFRLIISHDGIIGCNNNLFDDPNGGSRPSAKHCWRDASNPYSFGKISGEWELIGSCDGSKCGELEYEYSIGVTDMKESEITNSWSSSISKSVSAGISFGPISAGGDITGEKSKEVSQSMSQAFEQTASQTVTRTCDGNLYQWRISSTSYSALSSKEFTVKGNRLACIGSGYKPQCLPDHCGDDNCQSCK